MGIIYLLEFCHENDLDLLEVTAKKIENNAKKYPLSASWLKSRRSGRVCLFFCWAQLIFHIMFIGL